MPPPSAPPAPSAAPPAAHSGDAAAEQRRLFGLLAAVPSYQASPDPLTLIRAVNALQRLGRDRAVAVLRAYLAAAPPGDGRDGTFLVMRALFAPTDPPGYLPPMHVGAPEPAAPADPRMLPRFPLALVDDIPLVVVAGYMLAGKAERPEDHLALLAGNSFLARPLAPPDDPLAAIDRLAGRAGTPFLRDANLDDDVGRARILAQGMRLLGLTGERFTPGSDLDARWRDVRTLLARPIAWDAAAEQYRLR